ncbi:MAG: GGDEF domain-containing protein [Lachnospiraceae bacterium]|nr:GGDEF domain-containing protein [Lachnospiraceae bacterium]
MQNGNKRIRIGVLVGGILDNVTQTVCKGVKRAAKQLDVDIMVFPGKYLDRDLSDNQELMYEYQFNTIFSYAKKGNVDAILVLAGSIGCFTSAENMKKMLEQYTIPCVLIASKIDGYTSIMYDNKVGVKKGIEYLIEKVKCKKIGMIGGSSMNVDAKERKEAFFEAMQEHGLEVAKEWYVEGDLTRNSKKQFAQLLDQTPDLDAVFCVNDDTAMGFYHELKLRNLHPGKDISVLGFDDIVSAAKANPPLASVRADAADLGERALHMAVRIAQGEKVSDELIPTRFILRDSICESQNRKETVHEAGGKERLDDVFEEIFWRYNHEDFEGSMDELRNAFKKVFITIEAMLESKQNAETDMKELEESINHFFGLRAMQYADIENMLALLSKMQKILRERYLEKEDLVYTQLSLLYQKIIQTMDYQNGQQKERQETDNYSLKLFVRDMLQFEHGDDRSYTCILNNLEWLHIKNAFVYAFEKPMIHLYKEKFEVPSYLYLKAIQKEGVVSTVPSPEQKVPINKIFDHHYVHIDPCSCMVSFPLFSNEMLYGILVCDLTNEVFVNGEFLVNQMSSAMRIINLLQTNEEIQRQLEESYETMRENNIVLDTLSKSDGLTGILNRRGFYLRGEKMLHDAQGQGECVLVFYADMNNLKIINDRYGHEEGDFSLKLIARLLKENVSEKGIVGRIGGDEFAGVMNCEGEEYAEKLKEQIYGSFDLYNKTSSKEYNVTVSFGAVVIKATRGMTLEEILVKADEKLYEAKKLRKKEVAKIIES